MKPPLNRCQRETRSPLDHFRRLLLAGVLLLLVLILSGGCELLRKDSGKLKGLVLPGEVILVTETEDHPRLVDDLIYIQGLDLELEIGAIMQFVIKEGIAESYPYQAQGVSAGLVSKTSPVIRVPIDHAPRIKTHLGDKANLLDVREPWEYAGGHLAGSRNSPWSRLKGSEPKLQWDAATPLLIYGRDETESAGASRWFKAAGYAVVIDLGSMADFPYELDRAFHGSTWAIAEQTQGSSSRSR